jgi:hypothetical protein
MTENQKIFASKVYTDGDQFLSPKDLGVLSPELTLTEQPVQGFQVDVWEADQQAVRHLVVMAHFPELQRSFCEQLGTRLLEYLGDVVVSFMVRDEPGSAVVFIPESQRMRSPFLFVASAIAVVNRCCGWDESERIRVRCETTGESVELKNPQYENSRFEVEL